MTPREFFEAVVNMRKHQRAYARSNGRDKTALRYAKDAETKIDHEIARVQLIENKRLQPRLDL